MSLPPGFLDELKTRLPITQVVGRKVVWDQRMSKPHQGDMWAPCPFHQEKSASFHAVDRDGFYKCFGCQASGDVIKFVQETENVTFIEAIEILAAEAGMQMPSPDPMAREKADARSQLFAVTEAAVQFFRRALDTQAGAAARAYLDKRGLKPATRDRFEIGYAPGGFQALFDAMTAKGIAPDLLIGAGLAKASQKGGKPFDVFRDRIVFPIRDAQKRCIGFGGRAMDPSDPAKYLNSPQTPLFDKSRAIYNIGPARAASGKGGPIILAEGYMDVIALVEAGFETACAPMGTAITEAQLEMIWAASPEPVLMMDGDAAGQNAAHSAIARALPMLRPGRSLRFASLPGGKDPDDLLRAEGAEAMRAVLEGARPMLALLWDRAVSGKVLDSPERRAMLDAELRATLGKITDVEIRNHYRAAIRDLTSALFRGPARNGPREGRAPYRGGKGWVPPALPSDALRASELAQTDATGITTLEGVILAVLAHYPTLLRDQLALLEGLELADPGHRAVARALLSAPDGGDAEALLAHLQAAGVGPALETICARRHVTLTPCLAPLSRGVAPDPAKARLALLESAAKLNALRGWEREMRDGAHEIEADADEGLTWRLGQAAQRRARPDMPGAEATADVVTAANGMELDRADLDQARRVLDGIRFEKKRRAGGDDPGSETG